MYLPIILILISSFLCPLAWAQTNPSKPLEILVTGSAYDKVEDHSLSTTTIQTDQLNHRITTLPQVLSEQAGVHIKRFGGLEDATSISIRGSSAEEVLILYDGIPLNSAQGGGVDLSPLLLESLSKVTIHKQSTPETAGFGTTGGVVSLTSAEPKPGQKTSFSFSYGSFQTGKMTAQTSWGKRNFSLILSNVVSWTKGNFTFLDDNGTPINQQDDQKVKRQNNASVTVHPFFKILYRFDDKTRFDFVGHFIHKDQGVPGLSANQSKHANLTRTEWLLNAKVRRDEFIHPLLSFETQTYTRLLKHQFSDLRGEIGLGGTQDNDDDTSLFGQKFTLEYYPALNQILKLFWLYQIERFRPENFLVTPSQGGTSVRHQFNYGLSKEWQIIPKYFEIRPAFWMENIFNRLNNEDPSFLTPGTFKNSGNKHFVSAKMDVLVSPTDFWDIEASIGRAARFPSFPELFGDRGGVIGNPMLKPQVGIHWNAGFVFKKIKPFSFVQKVQLKTLYFERHIDDLIQFVQKAGFARALNAGQAQVRGLESQLYLDLLEHVLLTAHYTFQQPMDQADYAGRFLPGRPRHEMNLKAEYYHSRYRFFVSAGWMDDLFLDPLNTRVIKNRWMMESGLSLKPHQKLTFNFEAKNITNSQIVDVIGFPLPGRSFFGKIQWDL